MWWPANSSRPSYKPLKDQDGDDFELPDTHNDNGTVHRAERLWVKRLVIAIVPVLVILLVVLGSTIYDAIHAESLSPDDALGNNSATTPSHEGIEPSTSAGVACPKRREWRTLSLADKTSYVGAVKCLLDQPSTLKMQTLNVSAYSDFPYIHAHIGYRTHHSAPFLPWHRYFLHIYEITLKSKCNYDGGLVYWDWTLDADDLSQSPVFNVADGFGGNGNPDGEITVGQHGRCVIDGPFAGIQALWYDIKYQPHCLSRGFRNDDGLGKMEGKDLKKESIDSVLRIDDYETFVTAMEAKVHDAIPFGIGGDFETFTAPFDPLFYLHHVQLDRLWWLWQQTDGGARLFAYNGHNARHSIEQAQLSDEINMAGFAPTIYVQDVMDTSGDQNMLCYRY